MNSSRKTSILFLLLDLAAVFVVFNAIAYMKGMRSGGEMIVLPLLVPAVAIAGAIYLIDGYRARTDLISVDYTSQHVIAMAGAMLATLLFSYAIISGGFTLQSSRLLIFLSFALLVPATLSYRRTLYLRRHERHLERSLVFIGDASSARVFREECERHEMRQPLIFASSLPSADLRTGPDTARPFGGVLEAIHNGSIEAEAIVLRESSRELAAEVSQRLVSLYFRGVPTYTLELFYQVYWQKIPLYRLNQTWLFQEGFQIAREPVFERAKRISDLTLAGLGLILSAPVVALAALAVWIEDHGPVFYIQTRIGRNDEPFPLVKLRTMRGGADAGELYTRPGDPRITRVGRFLRMTRIDEFPQLWSVVNGKMSLIGPRPEWDRLVQNYEQQIPCYHFRHLVKPGITGWAQVNYPYGANLEDTVRKLEYDLYYIRHFSFVLDASIVLKTIHIMLFGKGR